ncbi:MAG: hypothetical protein HY835_14630 [Anaerolineae bacterium]|nr:hypothetical protein [Anaerolineae bacterium]
MNQPTSPIYVGDTPQKRALKTVQGAYVTLLGERFYKIGNYDAMDPFFMSIVSSSDHWLFLSSTGGLSAGRVSAERALFPYYTDDKLTENSENTGNKAIFRVTRGQRTSLWEPFSERQAGLYPVERNIYKNVTGSVVVFEEHNLSLGIAYRYAWRTSDAFGFIKTSWLHNTAATPCTVEFVDGLQNILPANVSSQTQNTFSCLLDAYKRSEIDAETGLAIFALNSTLTDLAEPSESLLATTVVQLGLEPAGHLLSSQQLERFRAGLALEGETEVLGQRCAYFVHATIDLASGAEQTWHLLADVNQDSAAIVRLLNKLRGSRPGLMQALEEDIAANNEYLERVVAGSDGNQVTHRPLHCAHHFANVLFNGMRGGVFADQYTVQKADFIEFLSIRNRSVLEQHRDFFTAIPSEINISTLLALAEESGVPELIRLCYSYLPLSFSRRHGDPSRPWNRFSIHIKKADGTQQINYEGNWRDIFQNWEALAYSYPEYIESMICTFVNATTVDGYNPYRITRQGIDWEVPEPNNPWANIGYWSDHQIIYLQKLMEISDRMHPGKLQTFLNQPLFSYANVPYRLKPYADLQRDPYNTIDFDWDLEGKIEAQVKEMGGDGKLVLDRNQRVLQVSLAEKMLTLLLAKLANFVPEGGIWMNTQRPEWNDANNALVGKGLSVVTLCYLRRMIAFYQDLLEKATAGTLSVSVEVQRFFSQVAEILTRFQGVLKGSFDDGQRRAMMDALGQAGSDYRWDFYSRGLSGDLAQLPVTDLAAFLNLAQQYVEHSLRANKRSDGLYHAYNILHFKDNLASVGYLYEMLEGQVAILSSGMLTGEESLALLENMRHSQLYRADQHTYILYPDRKILPFLEKNRITPAQVSDLALVAELVKAQDRTLIVRDEDGDYHFSGHIRNMKDVNRSLDALRRQAPFADLVKAEGSQIEALFEAVFRHNEFTGRSGTFFAYEGLGSIYWHMVSKLLLAVQETILRTRHESTFGALLEKYADIRKGQCFNKPPDVYGAFPTDPYSHTPKGKGAKQPGMTGMVKEEILARLAELGLSIENGDLVFDFLLLDRQELLAEPAVYSYWDVDGAPQQLALTAGSLAYSICQVPVILQASNERCITLHRTDGSTQRIEGHQLDSLNSRHIFQRDGVIHHLVVSV